MLTSLDTVRMILNVLEEVTICISAIDENEVSEMKFTKMQGLGNDYL